jgi:hypothetical protein
LGTGEIGVIEDHSAEAHQQELENRQHDETILQQNDPAATVWIDERDQQDRNMEINENTSWDNIVPSESKYLKQDDVGEEGKNLTVKEFGREVLKGDHEDEEKTILHFKEDVKPLVLNKANSKLLARHTGASVPNEAVGKVVNVYANPDIEFGGRITGGIRIRKATGEAEGTVPF